MASSLVELAPTREQIEGPYWLPGSPERRKLRERDTKGEPFTLAGQVVNIRGKPIEGAWLDFWHCDGEATYDVEAYRLRGHQWTDEEGRFRLETVVPSEYDDDLTNADGETRRVYRTAHIHVKVKAPRRGTLTTQLYFPDKTGNERDGYFGDDLAIEVSETPSGKAGQFTFVLR